MVNILYLFVTLPVGGAEEHLLIVIKNMDRAVYNPIVCCIRDKGVIGAEIEKRKVKVISLNRTSKSWDIRIVRDILKIISQENIHLVHAHLYHANMYGRIAAIIAKIPVVITEHNIYPKYKLKRRIINWFLAKKTKKIIAVSEMVKNYIIARDWIDPSMVETIYNGIDIKRFPSDLTKEEARQKINISNDCFLIGAVGRLTEQKGLIYLITAIKAIKEILPQVRLIITGSGHMESCLKNEVLVNGLDKYVVFLGVRRDIPDILRALDVFILPSLWEGLPMVLLEAMASSIPVIITPVGGVPEVINDGSNGIIVPPHSEAALSKAIIKLSEDYAERRRMGENGRKTIEKKFTASQMIKKLDHLYSSLLKQG